MGALARPLAVTRRARAQNRELQIMKQLKHTNVVELKNCFYSKGDKAQSLTAVQPKLTISPTTRACCKRASAAGCGG